MFKPHKNYLTFISCPRRSTCLLSQQWTHYTVRKYCLLLHSASTHKKTLNYIIWIFNLKFRQQFCVLLEKSIHTTTDYYDLQVMQNYINNARNRFLTVHGHIIFDLKHVVLCGFCQVYFCSIATCL